MAHIPAEQSIALRQVSGNESRWQVHNPRCPIILPEGLSLARTDRSCTSPESGGGTCTERCFNAAPALYQSISEGPAASGKV